MDPVLEIQNGLLGDMSSAPMAPDEEPMMSGSMDRRVPNLLGAAVVGAVVTLVALRAAGFRFSFGATIGGGQSG